MSVGPDGFPVSRFSSLRFSVISSCLLKQHAISPLGNDGENPFICSKVQGSTFLEVIESAQINVIGHL